MRRLLIGLLLVGVFGIGAAVSYFNWASVRFDYLAGETELPLVALLLATLLLGIGLMGILGIARVWALRLEIRRLQKKLEATEAELKSLRSLSLKDA